MIKLLNIERTLYVDELPSEINILNNVLKIELAKKSDGLFSNNGFFKIEYFYSNDICGAVLFFNEICVAILKDHGKNIYIFDSHSRNGQGQVVPDGTSVLLMFSSVNTAKEYIFSTHNNCNHYQIVYIKMKIEEQKRGKI